MAAASCGAPPKHLIRTLLSRFNVEAGLDVFRSRLLALPRVRWTRRYRVSAALPGKASSKLSSAFGKDPSKTSKVALSPNDTNCDSVFQYTSSRNITLDTSPSIGAVAKDDASDCRVMLVDGTSILYRAYYRLLAKLQRGMLEHVDGNGDWVLTIFSALSLLMDMLEFLPSHVAVVFDHDGVPFGQTTLTSKAGYNGKGLTFRHTLYPSYKSNRSPTPDTVVQGFQYLKASIKAMSIKVIEVPGVEADDVIGTLAVNSVNSGFKVRVVSPDKDFFQIICPSLRLLRISPRGSGMVSFGMEEFAEKYGDLKPPQFVDIIALMGDASDNIPGIEGIGPVNAVRLIQKFGSLENLLESAEEVEGERMRQVIYFLCVYS